MLHVVGVVEGHFFPFVIQVHPDLVEFLVEAQRRALGRGDRPVAAPILLHRPDPFFGGKLRQPFPPDGLPGHPEGPTVRGPHLHLPVMSSRLEARAGQDPRVRVESLGVVGQLLLPTAHPHALEVRGEDEEVVRRFGVQGQVLCW